MRCSYIPLAKKKETKTQHGMRVMTDLINESERDIQIDELLVLIIRSTRSNVKAQNWNRPIHKSVKKDV